MNFNTFCNICFIKQNIIKLSVEENEHIINTLISFTSCPDIVNDVIYLCINCCDKLEEYDKFRELLLTNFVRFRYLYNEHRKQLEIRNAPDLETKLKIFVDVNVGRPSGTPLIENYEATQALRNDTACNKDTTCRESDEESFKIDLRNFIKNDELMHTDTLCNSENNTSENEAQECHVKYENDSLREDQEDIHGITIEKHEPSLLDEASLELTNTDVTTSIPCFSSANNDNCNLAIDRKIFMREDTSLKADEPNPERFDKSHGELVSDTEGNVTPRRELDDDICDLLSDPQNCVTDDTTVEEGANIEKNKNNKIGIECNTGEKPFQCDVCQKIFTHKRYLIQHKFTHGSEKPYKCDDCGARFRRRYYLTKHKRVHTGERPYSCDECQKSFGSTSHLVQHKLTHSGEKPYQCGVCSSRFTNRANLNAHKRRHTGERPYSCDECQKSFAYISNLNAHKVTHRSEKPYICDECGLGLTKLSTLKKHKSLHTNDICQKSSTRSSYLMRHKRIHSSGNPYECDVCDLGFL